MVDSVFRLSVVCAVECDATLTVVEGGGGIDDDDDEGGNDEDGDDAIDEVEGGIIEEDEDEDGTIDEEEEDEGAWEDEELDDDRRLLDDVELDIIEVVVVNTTDVEVVFGAPDDILCQFSFTEIAL